MKSGSSVADIPVVWSVVVLIEVVFVDVSDIKGRLKPTVNKRSLKSVHRKYCQGPTQPVPHSQTANLLVEKKRLFSRTRWSKLLTSLGVSP